MDINLLPRKSFVEKRFFFLSFLVILLLLAVAYFCWSLYLKQSEANLALQVELQEKKTEKAILLANIGWNEEVKRYEEQVLDIKRYELLIDGLHLLEVDWAGILDSVIALLPSPNHTIAFSASGDYLSGSVLFANITDATLFVDQLKQSEHLKDVFIDVLRRDTQSFGYEVIFSAYLNLLTF